ncbi:hypothetical protein [Sphingobium sp. CCH11-B1]|uniref:hypothetical protein n=1 Tax=Sphingobium sp. CCH11-B1 TaxID=1768781 RepID=UPI001E35E92E|nr:hypothetical protein [Sphingobium sp. CCH11-B1]MEA3389610.1 hypothetical protein [Pseudomonadota bacterium]
MSSSLRPERAAAADRFPNMARLALLAWLICCAAMTMHYAWPFTDLRFFDTDDALRLEQVRALLAGQSWFDVTQHRVNPPLGGPMHWSRIVDLPIAAFILLARPLVGPSGAELFATIAVPLLLLGGLVIATWVAGRRIGGSRSTALLGVLLLLTAPSILVQFQPFRIDHHGWQIMLGAIATCGLFDTRPRRGGTLIGVALAAWLCISSEALPYVALFLSALGIQHLLSARDSGRLVGAAATLGVASLLLSLATRGVTPLRSVQCDALSVPYLFPLLALAISLPLAHAVLGASDWRRRLTAAGLGAGSALVALALSGGPCLSGDPFQSLGPLAYRVWYMAIMEGRPVWEQDVSRMGVIIIPSVFGLAATLAAAFAHRQDRPALLRWLLLALLLAGSTGVAALVMRALSMAHWLAIPGTAWLILTLFARVQASSSAIARVLGSVSLALLTPFGLSILWVGAVTLFETPEEAAAEQKILACQPGMAMRDVAALPPSMLFSPLDIGPTILVRTGHRIVATGHHRNAVGITTVIRGFTAPPAQARTIVASVNGGKGADYLLTCDDLGEYRGYVKLAPNGLAARLARGQVPAWLQPLPGKGPLHIYRVKRD